MFSSAQFRERDKRIGIEEKHRREIEDLDHKINNLRRSNNDIRKQLFDVVHRAERLAQGLGFDKCRRPWTCWSLEKAAEEAKAEVDRYSQQIEETVAELNVCKEKLL